MIRLCEHIEYDVFQVIREDIQNKQNLNRHRLFFFRGGGGSTHTRLVWSFLASQGALEKMRVSH